MSDVTTIAKAPFRLIDSETVPLTMAIAEKMRDMEPSPTERELNPKRLTHLREKAEAGHLVTFNWADAKIGNKVFRMNGQHSSLMLTQLNGAFPESLVAHLDHYEVDDESGLAVLFRQFDDRKSGRSVGDVAGAYQGLFPELREVSKATAKLGIEGVAWYRRNVEGVPVPKADDIYTLFHETALHPFIIWLGEVLSIKTPELRNVAVVAAMYATYCASDTAMQFWDEVARGGVEFEDNHPATILDGWLKKTKEDSDTKLKPANYYQGCAYAWVAFRDDKTLKDIRSDVSKGYHKIL